MKIILEPLVKARTDGIEIACTDGFLHNTFPILSAYIADYPEQCLVACCQENACPICLIKPKERGQLIHSVLHNPETTIHILAQQLQGLAPSEFKDHNMRPINPFWKDLLHCNIFSVWHLTCYASYIRVSSRTMFPSGQCRAQQGDWLRLTPVSRWCPTSPLYSTSRRGSPWWHRGQEMSIRTWRKSF